MKRIIQPLLRRSTLIGECLIVSYFRITGERMQATTLCEEFLEEINQDDSSELNLLRGEDWEDDDWNSHSSVHSWARNFCSIKFYKRQYAQGIGKEFLPPGHHPVALRERSIRTFGNCCWRVVR